jgi:rhodanese-related sulfurtransferase
MRGYFAYRILKLNGFKVKNLNGGFTVYANAKKANIMLKNS